MDAFVSVAGLLGCAVVGGIAFVVCVGALVSVHRPDAAGALLVGSAVGATGIAASAGFAFLADDVPPGQTVLTWAAVVFFAGFAAGLVFLAAMRVRARMRS